MIECEDCIHAECDWQEYEDERFRGEWATGAVIVLMGAAAVGVGLLLRFL